MNWLTRIFTNDPTRRNSAAGRAAIVIGPKPVTTIAPPARFAWDEKRWQRRITGDVLEVTGRYRVYDRQRQQWREFAGHLCEQGGHIAAYIADPPPEIRRHEHGRCLQLVRMPWFRLHWSKEPTSLDQALLYFEKMLDESLNPGRF